MSVYFYTALRALATPYSEPSRGHITTSFTKVEGKMPKLESGNFILPWSICEAVVTAVEYWAEADMTVAVVNCPSAEKHHLDMVKLGLGYEKEFIPHISLSKGDTAKQWQDKIGARYAVVDVYCGFVIKETAQIGDTDNYPADKIFQFVPNPDVQELPGYNYDWKGDKNG